jgi:hypothetical protein
VALKHQKSNQPINRYGTRIAKHLLLENTEGAIKNGQIQRTWQHRIHKTKTNEQRKRKEKRTSASVFFILDFPFDFSHGFIR